MRCFNEENCWINCGNAGCLICSTLNSLKENMECSMAKDGPLDLHIREDMQWIRDNQHREVLTTEDYAYLRWRQQLRNDLYCDREYFYGELTLYQKRFAEGKILQFVPEEVEKVETHHRLFEIREEEMHEPALARA